MNFDNFTPQPGREKIFAELERLIHQTRQIKSGAPRLTPERYAERTPDSKRRLHISLSARRHRRLERHAAQMRAENQKRWRDGAIKAWTRRRGGQR